MQTERPDTTREILRHKRAVQDMFNRRVEMISLQKQLGVPPSKNDLYFEQNAVKFQQIAYCDDDMVPIFSEKACLTPYAIQTTSFAAHNPQTAAMRRKQVRVEADLTRELSKLVRMKNAIERMGQ